MEIIAWIVFGALAGWIASMLVGNDAGQGAGLNIIIGIVGAVIGGYIMRLLGSTGVTGFNFMSLLIAVFGSVILLTVVRGVHR